jgi:hypothetical protein
MSDNKIYNCDFDKNNKCNDCGISIPTLTSNCICNKINIERILYSLPSDNWISDNYIVCTFCGSFLLTITDNCNC